MQRIAETNLVFLLGQLRWSLDRPLVYGAGDWATRVGRALDRLEESFDHHVAAWEGPESILNEISEPGSFPFTTEAQRTERLHEQHLGLRTQLGCLVELFRNGLQLFPCQGDTSPGNAGADEQQEVRAFRLFAVLCPCVRDLLVGLERHLAEESKLLHDADVESASHDRRRRAPIRSHV